MMRIFCRYVEGRWRPDCAGGCRNGGSWRENPHYLLRCHVAMHVAIRLSQEWNDDAPAIGFYVSGAALHSLHRETLGRLISSSTSIAQVMQGGSEVSSTTTFRSAEGNVLEVDLPESAADAPYVIIPCTFRPNIFSSFTLTVYGSEAGFDLRAK